MENLQKCGNSGISEVGNKLKFSFYLIFYELGFNSDNDNNVGLVKVKM
jgi:hypothetical protein